ncbi:MAG: hypothetical protein AB1397_07775 [bacterium]
MENLTTEEATQLAQDKENWERGGGYVRDLEGINNWKDEESFPDFKLLFIFPVSFNSLKKREVFIKLNEAFVSFINENLKGLEEGGK